MSSLLEGRKKSEEEERWRGRVDDDVDVPMSTCDEVGVPGVNIEDV